MGGICAHAQSAHLGVKAAPSQRIYVQIYVRSPCRECIYRIFSSARVMGMDPNSIATQNLVVSALLQELLLNCELSHTECFLHTPFASVYKM